MITPREAFNCWKPKYGVELVYFDYRDQLSEDQAKNFVMGNTDKVWCDLENWYFDAQFDAAQHAIEEVIRNVQNDDPEFNPDEDPEWREELREIILESDQVDPVHELAARSTFSVIMSDGWAIDEDNALWSEGDPAELVAALGVPETDHNLKVAAEVLSEVTCDLGMAYSAFNVRVSDIVNLKPGAAIIADQLPIAYGNPFVGSFWIGNFDLAEPKVIPLSELVPEDDLVCYGLREVFGEYPAELTSAKWKLND